MSKQDITETLASLRSKLNDPVKLKIRVGSFGVVNFLFGFWVTYNNLNGTLQKRRQDRYSQARYQTVSVMKGILYASTSPFSMMYVGYQAIWSPAKFQNHMIPLSKYGSLEDRQELDQPPKRTFFQTLTNKNP